MAEFRGVMQYKSSTIRNTSLGPLVKGGWAMTIFNFTTIRRRRSVPAWGRFPTCPVAQADSLRECSILGMGLFCKNRFVFIRNWLCFARKCSILGMRFS